MLEIQQYDFILNPFCGTFAAGIKGLVASMYLRNAAEYTGMSAAEASLRSALAENMVNSESVNRTWPSSKLIRAAPLPSAGSWTR